MLYIFSQNIWWHYPSFFTSLLGLWQQNCSHFCHFILWSCGQIILQNIRLKGNDALQLWPQLMPSSLCLTSAQPSVTVNAQKFLPCPFFAEGACLTFWFSLLQFFCQHLVSSCSIHWYLKDSSQSIQVSCNDMLWNFLLTRRLKSRAFVVTCMVSLISHQSHSKFILKWQNELEFLHQQRLEKISFCIHLGFVATSRTSIEGDYEFLHALGPSANTNTCILQVPTLTRINVYTPSFGPLSSKRLISSSLLEAVLLTKLAQESHLWHACKNL